MTNAIGDISPMVLIVAIDQMEEDFFITAKLLWRLHLWKASILQIQLDTESSGSGSLDVVLWYFAISRK